MAEQRNKTSGKFVAGHKGLGGRKPRSREEIYRDAFRTAISIKEWVAIIKQAGKDAIHPSQHAARHQARTFLANYLIGLPASQSGADVPDENVYAAMSDAQLLAIIHTIVDNDERKKSAKRSPAKDT